MLEFQHIVQVNDPSDNNAIVITRTQLWQGLLLRARNPEKFNPALQCKSSETGTNQFVRKISAGDTQFIEQVILHPETKVLTNTLPGTDGIFAESSALIEEPEPDALFVRFAYRREIDMGTDNLNVAEYLKAAYVQLDREAIALIRMLAQSENNNATVN